jgi:hypothetical protein
VDDEHDVVAEAEFVLEGEEEVALLGVGVAVRAGGVQLPVFPLAPKITYMTPSST